MYWLIGSTPAQRRALSYIISYPQVKQVLNTRTYKTLLLGIDFMQKVDPIIIDILGNQIKIGNRWLPGEKSEGRFRVNSEEEIILPVRTEKIHWVTILFQN